MKDLTYRLDALLHHLLDSIMCSCKIFEALWNWIMRQHLSALFLHSYGVLTNLNTPPHCHVFFFGATNRGRGGKTTLGNGHAWSSQSPRGWWRTGENGGNSLWNHVVPQRPSRLRWQNHQKSCSNFAIECWVNTCMDFNQIWWGYH